jgi:Family of unknown function (DUF6600)/FecR protein
MKRNLLFAVCIALVFLGTASAQVELSPGVARVSLIHGDVSSQRGDSGDWSAAALNQPVVAGDSISTGDRSQAELQLDHADILRLGNNSQAKVATLTRTQIQVQVGQGLAYYSVFKESEAQIEIDTPNVAIRPTSKDGVYRIQVSGGETQVIVRKGSADISTPQGSTRLEKGQAAEVRGTADEAEYKLVGAPSKDDWDSWNNERDSRIHNAQAWNHTNSYYVGSEDLDAYGHWVSVPDYGLVWAPVVPVGWAPYRVGRWVWEPYWGWTWASYEPWGWAPYHYGRWMFWNSSWVWWPGPVTPFYRPIWAPAYVSFFGFGGNWGVGFGFGGGWGFGNVGWLPIGPCDHFNPWWGRFGRNFNVVNITNITNINNFHGGFAPLHAGSQFSNLRLVNTNAGVRGGLSMVRTNEFATSRAVAQPVNAETFRQGRMMTGNLPLVPTKENLSVTGRPANVNAAATNQRFFTHNQPAAPQSFARQQTQLQESIASHPEFAGARSNAMQQGKAQNESRSAPVNRGYAPAATGAGAPQAAQPAAHDGWQRFRNAQEAQNRAPQTAAQGTTRSYSPATSGNDVARQSRQASQDGSGWRRFSNSGPAQNSTPASAPAVRSNVRTAAPASVEPSRPAAPASAAPARPAAPADRGWQRFNPQNNATEAPGRATGQSERWTPAMSSGRDVSGNSRGASSYRPSPQSYSRGESSYRQATPSYRPPLNLRQPIVTPRASGGGGYSRGGGGGSSAPSRGSGGSGGSGGGGSHGGFSGGSQSHGGRGR